MAMTHHRGKLMKHGQRISPDEVLRLGNPDSPQICRKFPANVRQVLQPTDLFWGNRGTFAFSGSHDGILNGNPPWKQRLKACTIPFLGSKALQRP